MLLTTKCLIHPASNLRNVVRLTSRVCPLVLHSQLTSLAICQSVDSYLKIGTFLVAPLSVGTQYELTLYTSELMWQGALIRVIL